MEIIVYDKNFKVTGLIDKFESVAWAERYDTFGSVEIDSYSIDDVLNILQPDYYLGFSDSDRLMVVETLSIKSDSSKADKLIIKGRSLESIFDRRIVWGQTVLSGNFQDCILALLNSNVINPTDPDRKINNFIFSPTTDPLITVLEIESQYTGDNLYSVISSLCLSQQIGFKVILNDSRQMVFSLYSGEDRSYAQIENPYVVFSPNFDNFLNGSYFQSKEFFKTITLVVGEGEGTDRKSFVLPLPEGGGSDLNRREIFTDASSISQKTPDGVLTDEEYALELAFKGLDTLTSNMIQTVFEGEIQQNSMYIYGRDYMLGDILQISDRYGHEGRVKIIEYFFIEDTRGFRMYPNFISIE